VLALQHSFRRIRTTFIRKFHHNIIFFSLIILNGFVHGSGRKFVSSVFWVQEAFTTNLFWYFSQADSHFKKSPELEDGPIFPKTLWVNFLVFDTSYENRWLEWLCPQSLGSKGFTFKYSKQRPCGLFWSYWFNPLLKQSRNGFWVSRNL